MKNFKENILNNKTLAIIKPDAFKKDIQAEYFDDFKSRIQN